MFSKSVHIMIKRWLLLVKMIVNETFLIDRVHASIFVVTKVHIYRFQLFFFKIMATQDCVHFFRCQQELLKSLWCFMAHKKLIWAEDSKCVERLLRWNMIHVSSLWHQTFPTSIETKISGCAVWRGFMLKVLEKIRRSGFFRSYRCRTVQYMTFSNFQITMTPQSSALSVYQEVVLHSQYTTFSYISIFTQLFML